MASGDCRVSGRRSLWAKAAMRVLSAMLLLAAASGGLAAEPGGAGGTGGGGGMKQYQTPYYVIHTDLSEEGVREAVVRMTRMAEEYRQRTRDFSGAIRSRLPFHLFSDKNDYYAAGGPRGSAGVFMGSKLMAIAGSRTNNWTWHVVQHEGFHQFARAVIGGDLPIWVNEGMAEYFGEAVFTGDGFVSGVIPPARLARIKKTIQDGRFKSIQSMMMLSHAEWNAEMSHMNYDQAWSMVQFLAHGEEGKYQRAFASFMVAIGKGQNWEQAWLANFGKADAFEVRWKEYWLGLDKNPTQELYTRGVVAVMTSFMARSQIQRQEFANFDALVQAGKSGQIKPPADDWLPVSLLDETLKVIKNAGDWSLEALPTRQSQIVLKARDGLRYVGTYQRMGTRVKSVDVEIDDLASRMDRARRLIEGGKGAEARLLLQAGLREHPRSPHAEAARLLMGEIR